MRKEGKAQNLHIQMKPMSSSSSKGISKAQAAKNFKHNKTLFPRMTIVSGKSQGDPSITIEPVVPTAFVEDVEEDSEEDNSNGVKNANNTEKKPSEPSNTNDDEEEEDDEDEEDEEGDGNEDDDDNEEEEEEEDDDEDEDEEEEEEEEMKVKEDTNVPGSLHTQYPGNFRVPDVYQTNARSSSSHETREPKRKTSTASPVASPAAPLAVSKPTNLTPGKERALKQIILYKMGMVTPEDKKEEYAKLYTVKNSLTDLQDVYNQLKVAASMNKSINWSKQICNLAVQGFETLMMKQKVVDLSLMEGWAMNTTLMLEDGEFDDMLSEMVGGSAADYHPLTRIGITLFFGGVGYYFTQKATRKHVGPAMGPSSFVNPMTSFMNAQAANAAPMGVPPGAQTNARPWYPPAAHNPVPPQPVHVHHHPSEQPQPMHPMSHEQIRRQQTSASEMQQKVYEREQARQQQSRASMLSSPKMAVPETTTARDMKLSDPVVDVPTISSMNNAAHRYTADKIKDYDEGKPNAVPKRKRASNAGSDSDDPAVASKWRKLRTPKVSDDDEDDEDEEEDSEDEDEDSSEDDDEEEENESPVSKRSRTQSNGKTKTASMLGSATLQAKIQKAMAMQKQARSDSFTGVSEQEPARANAIGTAAIPVTSAYVPLKRQTVDGPPPPVDPRGGETMSMFSSESIDPAQLAPLSSMVPVL